MGTFQVGLLLIGTFALLLALSVPVSVSIIISSVVTMASTLSLDLGTFVASQRMVGGVDSFSLLAVPFYILCGVLMNTGGIAQKLIDFAKILVGRIPGGLAHTNILGNTLFGSLSGSSVAASVAIGGVLIPMEEKEGYDKVMLFYRRHYERNEILYSKSYMLLIDILHCSSDTFAECLCTK